MMAAEKITVPVTLNNLSSAHGLEAIKLFFSLFRDAIGTE